MIIKYKGHSCFKVLGKEYSLCLDPYKNIGLNPNDIVADYYFCSHSHYDHDNFLATQGKPFEKYLEIISTYHDQECGRLRGQNKVLVFEIDGVKIAHLGDLGETDNNQLIDKLYGIDILLICIGGNYTINARQALDYINKIKPKIAIPMHYHISGSKVDIDTIDEFLSLSSYPYEYMEELEINGKIENKTKIIQLKADVL